MNFEKFLKQLSILSVSILSLGAASAHAQTDTGYAPPPMFEDMTPPMVRPEGKDGYLVEPKKSDNTKLPSAPAPMASEKPSAVIPRISVNPDAAPVQPRQAQPQPTPAPVVIPTPPSAPAAPVAVQQPKMMQPIIEEAATAPKPAPKKVSRPPKKVAVPAPKPAAIPAPVPPQKPVIETAKEQAPAVPATPIAPPASQKEIVQESSPPPLPPVAEKPVEKLVEETSPTPPVPVKNVEPPRTAGPVPRDPTVSAIKGPKSMPSMPATEVDQQVTFDTAKAPEEETLLERQQKEKTEETTLTPKPFVPAPKAGIAPASFDRGDQGAMKKTIIYKPGQIGLADAEVDPIAAGVVNELDKDDKKDWRVQIKSFATPTGTGLSSDRRTSLSRALSLRSTLIAQGVSASRIDILSSGMDTEAKGPQDRIDLYLYGPTVQ